MTTPAQNAPFATLLDLINANDPYPIPSNPLVHPRDNVRMTPLHLVMADYRLQPPILPIGHIHPLILADMLAYNISASGKVFTFYPVPGPRAHDVVLGAVKSVAFHDEVVEKGQNELTRIVDALVEFMRKKGTVPENKFGPNEDRFSLYASPSSTYFGGKALGPRQNAVATVARSRSGFFGCATFGVAATLYEGEGADTKIWVQNRGSFLASWGGMLNSTASGALTAGMTPLKGMVQECTEEADLPEDFCTDLLKFTSSMSFWLSIKAWVRPHTVIAFELQLKDDMPRPKVPGSSSATTLSEGPEVDGYRTMSPAEVKQALLKDRFQPCAVYPMVDFLDRHGLLDGEEGMEEVRMRSRREQGVAKPVDMA